MKRLAGQRVSKNAVPYPADQGFDDWFGRREIHIGQPHRQKFILRQRILARKAPLELSVDVHMIPFDGVGSRTVMNLVKVVLHFRTRLFTDVSRLLPQKSEPAQAPA
jgi:hypothetical protein